MTTEELMSYLITPAAQVAIIIGLAEIIKKVGCPARWIPLIDLALGVASGVSVYGFMQGKGIAYGVLIGLALGLSACGLFSGIKNISNISGTAEKAEETK